MAASNRLIPLTVTTIGSIPLEKPVVKNLETDAIRLVTTVSGGSKIQWRHKSLNYTNEVWIVEESQSAIVAKIINSNICVPIAQVNITDLGGNPAGYALINTWLCDNLRTYNPAFNPYTTFQYPLNTGDLGELITVSGTQDDIVNAPPLCGGAAGGGASFDFDTIMSQTEYTFPQLAGKTIIAILYDQLILQPSQFSLTGDVLIFNFSVSLVVQVTVFYQ